MTEVSAILSELVDRIVAVVQSRRIILFGSAARGDFRPGSDFDVLVVVPEGSSKLTITERIYVNLVGFPVPVDIVVASEADLDELKDNTSLVYYAATREGRELYAA